MSKSNSVKAEELVAVVQDLEAVIAKGRMPASHLAKLYGFTEKLLLTRVDNMEVNKDGTDLPDDGLRKTRKGLVGRCNALMDALEALKESVDSSETRRQNEIAAGVCLGDSDELQLSVVLNDCTALHTANTTIAGEAASDAPGAYTPTLLPLWAGSFFPSLTGLCVVARHDATPFLGLCAREEGSRIERPVHNVFTHSAAAAAVATLCPRPSACYMFISFTTHVFYYSIIRIKHGAGESQSSIEYVLSRQHQITTSGRCGLANFISSSAATLIPLLQRSIEEIQSQSPLHIDAILVCSYGSRTHTMYSHIRKPLLECFEGIPVLAPTLDLSKLENICEANALQGVIFRPDYVAYGAAVLAMSRLLCDSGQGSVVAVYNEPISCLVAVRSRVMPGGSYSADAITSDSSDRFDSLMTAMPIFFPSDSCSSGNNIEKELTLVACNTATESKSTQKAKASKPTRVGAECAADDLYVEIVQVEIGCNGMGVPGWHDGLLQSAVTRKGPSVLKAVGGLSPLNKTDSFLSAGVLSSLRDQYRYRILGRYRIDQLFMNEALSQIKPGEPVELQQVIVKLGIDSDRNVSVAIKASGPGAMDTVDDNYPCNLDNSIYRIASTPSFATGSSRAEDEFAFCLTSATESGVLKKRANSQLQEKSSDSAMENTQEAVYNYSLGLQWDPLNSVLYSNRCAARLKLCALQRLREDPIKNIEEWLSQAWYDAQVCAQLKPGWSKGHSRLGEVLFHQNRLEASLEAYTKAYNCELTEKNLSHNAKASNNSTIYKALTDVRGALELQVATKAAQEAERMLQEGTNPESTGGSGHTGTKKRRKKDESSSGSTCVVS